MKTLTECLLLAAFVFCVAFAAFTRQPLPIIAAGIAAALLIGYADDSAPRRRYLPGQRRSARVRDDIRHVGRQIHLWQAYVLLCVAAMLASAACLLFLINAGQWPGALVDMPFVGAQPQGLVLGIVVGGLMLYCLTVSVGCVQPLETVLCRLHTELDGCMNAEAARDATAGHPDWKACNQADWDDPAVTQRLLEERARRLFGD